MVQHTFIVRNAPPHTLPPDHLIPHQTPTHTYREACAIDLVANLVPEPSVTARRAAADAAGEYALSRGVCV